MRGVGRSAEKESFWRLVLEEQRGSGLSVRAFCKQESLAEASFYGWRKELEKRDQAAEERCAGTDSEQPGTVSAQPTMIPVNVVDEAAPPSPVVSPSSTCSLEVLTPSGFTLRFDRQLEPERLRILLHAIASCGDGVSSC